MCGRYFFKLNDSFSNYQLLKEKIEQLHLHDFREGEVFPSQSALVLVPTPKGDVDPSIKKWGMEGYQGKLLINARMEGIEYKYTFRPLLHHRCVILANGFYEWMPKDHKKDKMYIEKQGQPLLYFAGIYNEKNEFVIVTGESTGAMAKIHKRTPIIMKEDQMIEYLYQKRDFMVDKEAIVAQIV